VGLKVKQGEREKAAEELREENETVLHRFNSYLEEFGVDLGTFLPIASSPLTTLK
jgi:hypothetical protein